MLAPSQYPEVGRWPAIRELLHIQVDMQIADLRTLLCLPRQDEPGLGAGCNLTAATLAFNIIAGASVLFWQSSVAALKPARDRGQRFQNLVQAKYPWSDEDAVDAEFGSKLMWDWARSPLTHTLGVGKNAHLLPGQPRKERGVWFLKSEHGLSGEMAEDLMSSYARPALVLATVTAEYGGYAIYVETLAWGITRMLRDLFADEDQASRADATARELLQLH